MDVIMNLIISCMLHVTSYIFIIIPRRYRRCVCVNHAVIALNVVVPIYNITLPKRKCYKMILINDFNKKYIIYIIQSLLKAFYFY